MSTSVCFPLCFEIGRPPGLRGAINYKVTSQGCDIEAKCVVCRGSGDERVDCREKKSFEKFICNRRGTTLMAAASAWEVC